MNSLPMAGAFNSLTTEPKLDPLVWSDDSLVMLDTEPSVSSSPSKGSPVTTPISANITPDAAAPVESLQEDTLDLLEYKVENQVNDQASAHSKQDAI